MRLAVVVGGVLLLRPLLGIAAADAPSWVQEIASRAMPAYDAKVPVAVLLDEQRVTVDGTGKVTTDYRKAIKVLTREGRNEAAAGIPYVAGSDKVRDVHAWLVASNGFIKTYSAKDGILDVSAGGDSLYDEIRIRLAKADNPEIGAVFVFQGSLESKPFLSQDAFAFQGEFPTLMPVTRFRCPQAGRRKASFSTTIPSLPWSMDPPIPGNSRIFRFTRTNRAHRRDMDWLHVSRSTIGRHRVCTPPAPCFQTWQDASRYLTALSAGQDDPSDQLAAEAKQLTASRATQYEKIQAIGHYVQKVKYISVQMNLAKGGGYKPHAAASVFLKQYGDCKDKANLMRAMLRAAGIPSYLVVIYAGDRTSRPGGLAVSRTVQPCHHRCACRRFHAKSDRVGCSGYRTLTNLRSHQ